MLSESGGFGQEGWTLGHESSAGMGPGTWGRGRRRERRKSTKTKCVEICYFVWRQRGREGERVTLKGQQVMTVKNHREDL